MNNHNLDLSIRLWSDYHDKERALKRMHKSIVELHKQLKIDRNTMNEGKRLSQEGVEHEIG
jgi:hypothetical protein